MRPKSHLLHTGVCMFAFHIRDVLFLKHVCRFAPFGCEMTNDITQYNNAEFYYNGVTQCSVLIGQIEKRRRGW